MLRRLRSSQAPLTIALLVAALLLMPLAGQAMAKAPTITTPCDAPLATADVPQALHTTTPTHTSPSDPCDPAVHGSRQIGHCSVSLLVVLLPDAQHTYLLGADISLLPGRTPLLGGRATNPAFKPPRHG